MRERALYAMIAHLEAKQMASDFVLEVLFGYCIAGANPEERDEQLAKIAMLARERTTASKTSSPEDVAYLEALMPDFVAHVDRLCRRISARAADTSGRP